MPLAVSVILIAGALTLWVPDYVAAPADWLALSATQLLVLLSGSLLAELLYRARAMAHRSAVPVLLYILSCALLPEIRTTWQPQVLVLTAVLVLLIMQAVGDHDEPLEMAFLTTLLVCLTSLIVRDALWLMPFVWVVPIVQRQFTIRVFTASLLGVGLFLLYFMVISYVTLLPESLKPILVAYFQPLTERYALFEHGLHSLFPWVIISYMVALIIFVIATLMRSSHDYVQTRNLTYQLILLYVMILPFALFLVPDVGILALLPWILSAMASIYLFQKESVSRGVTLLVYIAVCAILYTAACI